MADEHDDQGTPGEGGEDAGGGDAGKTYTQEEVDRLIADNEAGLKANRDRALDQLKSYKRSLDEYSGVDVEEYRKLKKAKEEADTKRAKQEGDWKALEEQLKARHAQELQAKEDRISRLERAVERRLVDAELTRAIAAKKGDADLLLPHARNFVKVRETEDDDYEAFVVDEHGQPAVLDGQGTPMTFDALVEERLMQKYPRAFEGTGSSGGGASKSRVGDPGQRRSVLDAAAGQIELKSGDIERIARGEMTVNLPTD